MVERSSAEMKGRNLQELSSPMFSRGSLSRLLPAKEEDRDQEHFKTDHLLTNLRGLWTRRNGDNRHWLLVSL